MKLPAVMPWEKVSWNESRQQTIYRDWGVFYTSNQHLSIAEKYYDKSLELKKNDSRALHFRSICKRYTAQTKSALKDAMAAAAIDPTSVPIRTTICDALYEMNEFEKCKVELHDNVRRFHGNKVDAFVEHISVLKQNFEDSVGENLGPFIFANGKYFKQILEEIHNRTNTDLRPLWKKLREQEKCDVLSILEKEEILISPREVARRERAFKVFNQMYFNRNWRDVLFLKNLRKNSNLLLPQMKYSTPILKKITNEKYDIVYTFLKMLHARSPLYNEQRRKCPDRNSWQRHREAHLNRVQYKTRRNMHTILRSIRELREAGNIQKLSRYIENVMGDYVVLKTHRVMPWKFEFINEVYNTLALAHADRYMYVPTHLRNVMESDRVEHKMMMLLRLPIDKHKDRATSFVFGDRTTYQEPDAMLAYKLFLARLEKRMHFAKHGIERCYLLHEMARCHLSQSRYDECCSAARKAIEEAKLNGCMLWRFLCVMLIVKSHSALKKIERCREELLEADRLAKILKSPALLAFVLLCQQINDNDIAIKRRNISLATSKRRSILSISSQSLPDLTETPNKITNPDKVTKTSTKAHIKLNKHYDEHHGHRAGKSTASPRPS